MDFTGIKKKFEALGYSVRVFQTKEEAADYLDSTIDGVSVSNGGSLTIKAMGLMERLAMHNQVETKDFIPMDRVEERVQLMRRTVAVDVYLSGINGISEDGYIVNIDGIGNRVASTAYGHDRVILIAGRNKIAPDLDSAIKRARNTAAPLNSKRLDKKTPCAVNGDRCYNCYAPDCSCRAFMIFRMAPTGSDYELIFIDEDLGL